MYPCVFVAIERIQLMCVLCVIALTRFYVIFLTTLQVTKDKQWNEIAQLFYEKHDVLNAGYLLKQHYIRYMYNCDILLYGLQ